MVGHGAPERNEMNYMSERQRASIELAERSYDRILMAGPPEPPVADVTVEYNVWIDREECTLKELTTALGGEAHFASGREGDMIEVKGSTLVEDVESAEEAEEVLRSLLVPLENVVDVDNLVITAQDPFEVDEPDWDARAKDERAEREFDREHGA